MPIDRYSDVDARFLGAVSRHFAITPSNDTDLTEVPLVLYCATAGTVKLRDQAGTDLTYTVEAHSLLPIRAVRVLATGTTASVIGWV